MKSNKAAQYAISHFGRRFLNDPFWSKYDAILHTGMGSNAPGAKATMMKANMCIQSEKEALSWLRASSHVIRM
eukprot:6144642-Pleurochrysis_carterae.AAC.6